MEYMKTVSSALTLSGTQSAMSAISCPSAVSSGKPVESRLTSQASRQPDVNM